MSMTSSPPWKTPGSRSQISSVKTTSSRSARSNVRVSVQNGETSAALSCATGVFTWLTRNVVGLRTVQATAPAALGQQTAAK